MCCSAKSALLHLYFCSIYFQNLVTFFFQVNHICTNRGTARPRPHTFISETRRNIKSDREHKNTSTLPQNTKSVTPRNSRLHSSLRFYFQHFCDHRCLIFLFPRLQSSVHPPIPSSPQLYPPPPNNTLLCPPTNPLLILNKTPLLLLLHSQGRRR